MNVKEMRKALLAAVKTVSGLNADVLRENPVVPCGIVYPDGPIQFDLTFDGTSWPHFCVLLLVPYGNTKSAQDLMDDYLSDEGAKSVKVAIETNAALKAVVSSAECVEFRNYGVTSLNDGGTQYLSAEIVVEIIT